MTKGRPPSKIVEIAPETAHTLVCVRDEATAKKLRMILGEGFRVIPHYGGGQFYVSTKFLSLIHI